MKHSPHLITILIALATVTAHAGTFRTLWGTDNYSVSDAASTYPWEITDKGIVYRAVVKGDPYNAWRSPTQQFRANTAAMGIQFNPTGTANIAGNPADKLNYSICPLNQSFSLVHGDNKAVGFAMYLPSNFPTPAMQTASITTNVIITQFWQGLRPPAAISLINDGNGNLKWQPWIMNETTGGSNSSVPIKVNTTGIARGQWVRFVMEVKLNYAGGGYVKVWQNGTQVVNWSGKVGYRTGFKNDGGGVAGPNCSCDIGLYRNHGQLNTMQAFFDVGKFGDAYADVAP
jgi:hypothetical protein